MPSMAQLEVRNCLIRCAVNKRSEFSSDGSIESIAVDLRSCAQVIEKARHDTGDMNVQWSVLYDIEIGKQCKIF